MNANVRCAIAVLCGFEHVDWWVVKMVNGQIRWQRDSHVFNYAFKLTNHLHPQNDPLTKFFHFVFVVTSSILFHLIKIYESNL